jgi:hypothetical protein
MSKKQSKKQQEEQTDVQAEAPVSGAAAVVEGEPVAKVSINKYDPF